MRWWLAVLGVWFVAHVAHAQEQPAALKLAPAFREEAAQPGWLKPGVLTGAVSALPSFLLHGTGAFLIGDRKTARRLAIAEGAGLGVLIAAGTVVVVTGSSRRLIGTMAPMVMGGFGVFMLSFLADVYAATTGGRPDARAPRFVPWVEAELGYQYVYDPQFRYSSFLVAQADLRAGDFRASPSAHVALDDDNQRFGLDLAYRALGRTRRRRQGDGSYADLAMGLRHHRFGNDGFAVITPEWRIDGRLDLARVGDSLAGSFVQGQLGAALELYDFDVRGSRVSDNAFGMLLGRFGFGVYFGDGGRRSGELMAYYDHRHDDFAAGMGTSGVGAGILGHVGLRGHYYVSRNWGLAGLSELGSAFVLGLSLRYRRAPEEG